MSDDRKPLDGRQQKIVTFVSLYIEAHGFSPTIREIGEGCGIKSTSTIAEQLVILEARGYVTRGIHGSQRALGIIP
jgi:repressor LexA